MHGATKQKKRRISYCLTFLCTIFCLCNLTGCTATREQETAILLSDSGITVDGAPASTDADQAVYTGADIVYYQAAQGTDYGEGTAEDEHNPEEAAAHTVVTITQPGVYRLSGSLSKGQVAVDLGDNAKEDPNAIVELILDNVEITNTVAPGVIFYNVYETESTEQAGAIVTLADGSDNTVNGSYVARIYQEGTTENLHRYDGAFYSKMSMLIQGETEGTGKLTINGENEGLDSELHLTVNSGNIYITANDDGINTNEDGVSVTTINGGYLYINAGLGEEGDGIDSNGSIVINGGTLIASASEHADEGGIDADLGITINGGTVLASGKRNDSVSSDSQQPFMELNYAFTQAAETLIHIEDAAGNEILNFAPLKSYESFTYSAPNLQEGVTYQVYAGGAVSGEEATGGLYPAGGTYTGGTQQQYSGTSSGAPGRRNGEQNGRPDDQNAGGPPEIPDDSQRPPLPPEMGGEAITPEDGSTPPEAQAEQAPMGQPDGERPDAPPDGGQQEPGSTDFILSAETHTFNRLNAANTTSESNNLPMENAVDSEAVPQ